MKTNFASKKESGFTFVNGTAMTVKTDLIRTADPFQSLFPIREDALNRIISDMKRYGFDNAHPIILWAGHKLTVVDGHTRLLAAKRLGIKMIPVVVRDFESEAKALEYAIDSQRNRRNLTDAELMRCITALDKRKKPGPREKGVTPGKSAARTGSILGISQVKVEKIRSLLDHAPEEIKEAVRSGSLTINKAYVITMEKVKTDKCRNEDEFRTARLEALSLDTGKIAKSHIEFELKRPPSIHLTKKEAAKLLKEISTTLKTELDKLAQ